MRENLTVSNGINMLANVLSISLSAPVQEPMSLLKSTLQALADHKTAAERYLVVLAMEATEDGHEAKAMKLAEDFKGRQVSHVFSNRRSCFAVQHSLERCLVRALCMLHLNMPYLWGQVQAHDVDKPQTAAGGDEGKGVKCGLGSSWCTPGVPPHGCDSSLFALIKVLCRYDVWAESLLCIAV